MLFFCYHLYIEHTFKVGEIPMKNQIRKVDLARMLQQAERESAHRQAKNARLVTQIFEDQTSTSEKPREKHQT